MAQCTRLNAVLFITRQGGVFKSGKEKKSCWCLKKACERYLRHFIKIILMHVWRVLSANVGRVT